MAVCHELHSHSITGGLYPVIADMRMAAVLLQGNIPARKPISYLYIVTTLQRVVLQTKDPIISILKLYHVKDFKFVFSQYMSQAAHIINCKNNVCLDAKSKTYILVYDIKELIILININSII